MKQNKQEEFFGKNSFSLLSGIVVSAEITDLQQFKFDTGSQFSSTGYIICNEISKRCNDIGYLPSSRTFVMTDNSFCRLVEGTEEFISDVAMTLNVDESQALTAISDFFSDRAILVQQSGIQGHLYKVGTFIQTAGSAAMVAKTMSIAKMAGVTGLQIIKAQPLVVVALPTVGAIFFHGCGSIIGNNTVGRTFNTIGNVLNLPMAYCESVYSAYISPLILKTTGIPTLFNYTKQAMRGPGLDSQEATKLLGGIKKESIIKNIKCWVIKKLGGNC